MWFFFLAFGLVPCLGAVFCLRVFVLFCLFCSPCSPRTYFINQAGFRIHKDPPLSALQVLGLMKHMHALPPSQTMSHTVVWTGLKFPLEPMVALIPWQSFSLKILGASLYLGLLLFYYIYVTCCSSRISTI